MTKIKTLIRRPNTKQGLDTNFDQSLEPRWILNTGETQIKIWQDERFSKYVLARARQIIPETILESGEYIYFTHEYFRIDPIGDHTKASIRDCFTIEELNMYLKILNEK